MKIDTFANRLNKAMMKQNMKQIDLANKSKIDKSLINKYLKGVAEAGNDNLPILADALNVNEVWLMGYDVPSDYTYEGGFHDDKNNRFYFRVDTNKKDNILDQYKVLFDKDSKLTDVQKEFIMNTITEQHKKFDEEQEKID